MHRIQAVFNGTEIEGLALVEAIGHNCACKFSDLNVRQSTCPPHKALIEDQRWLDGLLCSRRRAEQLLYQEFMVVGPP